MTQSLRDQARAGRPADRQPKLNMEATIVFDVGDDPESVPVRVAWARVMRFCAALPKGSTATVATKTGSYSYKYRGIDDVITLAGRALREFGVTIMPIDIQMQHKIGQPTWCKVDVTYLITSLGEGEMKGVSSGESLDFGDKALVKALTQCLRVFLTTALTLPTYDMSMDSDATPITRPVVPTALELRDEMLDPSTSMDRMKAIYNMLTRDQDLAVVKVPIAGMPAESLWDLNVRIGKERRASGRAEGTEAPGLTGVRAEQGDPNRGDR